VSKIDLKSKSPAFKEWVEKMDHILAGTEITTPDGQDLEYQDDHFQDRMKRLQQSFIPFELMPVYPLNETSASKLVYDEIKAKKDLI